MNRVGVYQGALEMYAVGLAATLEEEGATGLAVEMREVAEKVTGPLPVGLERTTLDAIADEMAEILSLHDEDFVCEFCTFAFRTQKDLDTHVCLGNDDEDEGDDVLPPSS